MLKRTITGALYVLFIAGFFLLREVDHRLFALMIYLFAIVGTFEITRALKPYLINGNYNTQITFGVGLVPMYCVFEYIIERHSGGSVIAIALLLALGFGIACKVQKKNNDIVAANMLGYFYPVIPLVALLSCNDLAGSNYSEGFIALLLCFVCSSLSDTFAYFIGSFFGGKKLCPKLSPKKTWSGAIGGVIGGIVGAILVLAIFGGRVHLGVENKWLFFIIIGAISSVLTIIGDLFESSIKRKVGIKDMGNILPGHGGILDRIDGISFVALFIYVVFIFV